MDLPVNNAKVIWFSCVISLVTGLSEPDVFKIISNGYWTCAEIRGLFKGGEALIYHAETPEKAEAMITVGDY